MALLRRSRKPQERVNQPAASAPGSARAVETAQAERNRPSILQAFSSLSLPKFRTLWLGMFFSLGAMQIEIVSRSWLAYDLSDSALILGLVAMARSIPQVVLSPLAGVWADRFDRRQLLLISQTAMLVLALGNALLVHLGIIEIWHLFALGLLQGIAFPFTMPARTAFMSDLVGKEHMANALALDSTGRNLNMIAAPSIAGVLLAINPTLAFYAITIMYGFAVYTLFKLPKGSRGGATKGGAFTQMLVGFQYIWSNRVLATYILLALVPILIGMPFQQLLPVFQKDVLEVSPSALGLMYTMVGVGALAGSLGAAYYANSPRMGIAQIICGIAFGIVLTLFALSPVFVLSLALLLLVGLTSQTYLTINRSLLMLNTDPSLYGRVTSVYVMLWYLMPVSLLPLGAVADRVGVSATVAACGLVLTLVIAGAVTRSPAFFRRAPASVEVARG